MIKVSVIVPVYNVEDYLIECLTSIINQTLKEIEIICIDDCGTDNSINILKEYAKKDDRIRIISHKENKGLGPARNTGIKESKGEYISFIDSDDYISRDYLENLYNTIIKYDTDIVSTINIKRVVGEAISLYSININKYLSIFQKIFKKNHFEGISNANIKDEKENTKNYPFVVAWNKLYKKSFLLDNDLFFMDIKKGSEDEDFYQRVLLNSPSISYNHKSIYYYRERNYSLTEKYCSDPNFIINNISLMQNSINYCKEKTPDLLNDLYIRIYELMISKFHQNIYQEDNYIHIHNFFKHIFIDYRFLNLKNRLKRMLYNEYVEIKVSDTYYKYLLFKRTRELNNEIYYEKNWFRLFGINNLDEYLVIILFGMKLSIKKLIRVNK
ncbi:glycosyltransferase [Brachyspira pilosicoli]|uniref:Glycosyltransferase n=1 Tax=Brachyspira pilosicoli TaxID=52584 RepID=A0AAJ6G7F4_BRAPL|nr:glycosyltransferase family 2 protein [Brachyspira pilosicoli]WIH89732.1 glycosyltransferase [Brachyspira pilosicoli]WIH92027.1 glycosyltransferase [Brachyspira pilosicoli]WIH94256.1 glycosyltransferase [Brachyspira pilosicoli]